MARRSLTTGEITSRELQLATEFEYQVAEAIEASGFYLAQMQGPRAIDLVFETGDGDLVAVECKSGMVRDAPKVAALVNRLGKHFGPLVIRELIFVARSFSPAARKQLESYQGVKWVDFDTLPEFLKRYRKPRSRKPAAPRVAQRVKGNRDDILTACQGLSAAIDDKLTALRNEKPNSDEAIGQRDASISDYEKLKAEVQELRAAVEKFTANKVQEKVIEKKVSTFGGTIENWWRKQGAAVLTTSSGIALVSLAALLANMLGVNAHLAYALAGSLYGGPKLVEGAVNAVAKLSKSETQKKPR